MNRILVVEDELAMRRALEDALTGAGYRVLSAADGETGLARILAEKPDLVVLDVMMPRLDGFALCRELRRLGFRSPILFLTARGRMEDRVRGLDLGGDDYLVKPFGVDELLARVRAVLRRTVRAESAVPSMIRLGAVEVDFDRCEVSRLGRVVHLSPKEFSMLRLLVEAEGAVVGRDRFLDVVWGMTAFPSTRTVDTHMASLRAKVEEDPEKPRFLKTVHGVGYRLVDGVRKSGVDPRTSSTADGNSHFPDTTRQKNEKDQTP
ncbi:MAG: DNA-binding response regulator [Proteobacteria bacterium]|nr:DNA-binding response regulator [Pseudomonadota bacterium]